MNKEDKDYEEYMLLKVMIKNIQTMPQKDIKNYVNTFSKYIDYRCKSEESHCKKSKKTNNKRPLDALTENLEKTNINTENKRKTSKDIVSNLKKLKLEKN